MTSHVFSEIIHTLTISEPKPKCLNDYLISKLCIFSFDFIEDFLFIFLWVPITYKQYHLIWKNIK